MHEQEKNELNLAVKKMVSISMVLSRDDILVNVSNTEKQIVNGPFGSYFFRYSVFLCIQSECGKVREKCGPE